ncbi:MAG: hypothetical protein GX448_05815 [Planctomycetes bacterium]|nr:hypothetical protein [Planctomycetota bacterium]
MNSRLWAPCLVFLSGCLAGCGGPIARDCRLSPVEKTFVLSEPYEFTDSAGTGGVCLLAPGVYRCYYMDPCGDYYEAPFTTKREYYFSGNRRGGVYVTRNEPRECRTYVQDNEITHYYGYAGGGGQFGGSGKFVILTKLPEDFLGLAKFSPVQEGASHDENQ